MFAIGNGEAWSFGAGIESQLGISNFHLSKQSFL